jgi:hypothetical protein
MRRRWVRIIAAYHVWLALRLYIKALIFVWENGGLWGAYFAFMRKPVVQRHWAEFLYSQVSGYGYGETAHWTDA